MAEAHLGRQLEVEEAFRGRLLAVHPDHPHLAAINAGIEDIKRKLASGVNLDQKLFSKGALKDIARNHGQVLDPFETSLAGLEAARNPFWNITYRGNEFMNLGSRPTQVAIFPRPKEFYVPESNKLSLDDQRALLEVDLEEVIKKRLGIGGMEFVIGDVATHAALPFAYLERNGNKRVRLHGRDYGYRYARTETPAVDSCVAHVGYFYGRGGLDVLYWYRDRGDNDVWAVRLGVPAQE